MEPAVLTQSVRRRRDRYWLHVLLLLLTILATSFVGARLARSFDNNRPIVVEDSLLDLASALGRAFAHPSDLLPGLPYSFTLLTILFAHEMGHYLACVYYEIDASLPYFIPMPVMLGTMGAFIRIRSAICSKRQLFDVGIAGPLAGFAFALPALAIGVAYSKVIPGMEVQGDIVYGAPLVLRLLEAAIFPGIPAADIYLHPVVRAAWVGVFATALNLLPIGQLDGGHVLYAFIGEKHRFLSKIFVAALIPLGYFSPSWILWAVLLFFFGLRHPSIYDSVPLGRGRVWLGSLALLLFFLCFMLQPIRA